MKHDVHWVNHPKNSAPELEPDHELSCQYHHGRKLMQEESWKDWYKGTEQWYRYIAAPASARQNMAIPPMRDPSQFPIKSFFEVDERTGRNRYGLKPTCVTAKRSSRQKQSIYLGDPVKFMWKFGILDKAEDKASINLWKRYIYDYLTLTFSWLVKRPDGFAIPRDDMKNFFCGGGPFDFTRELEGEIPDQSAVEKLWIAVGNPKASLRIPWNQVYPQDARKSMRGKKLPFTHEKFKEYLEKKYPQVATRLSPMPNERPPRGGSQLLKAYTIMVILGECRARVLSREVGKYDTGYVKFSNRRRDTPIKRVADRRHQTNQKEILARGKGLVSLADYSESWQQPGQTLDDLDAESLEYFNAWEAGDLVDPYRQPPFDRFSKENAPPPAQVIPQDVPKSLSQSPSPVQHVPAPRKRIVRPSPSPSVQSVEAIPPVEVVSNDPAPENRPNPRASTSPPVFNTSVKPELESATPSPAPHFDTARGASLGHSLTPPPGLPVHPLQHIPEPQIKAHCPLPEQPRTAQPRTAPLVKGERDASPSVVEIVKKRVTWAEDVKKEPETKEVNQSNNTMYILFGLAFVGIAVWLGEEKRVATMPYY